MPVGIEHVAGFHDRVGRRQPFPRFRQKARRSLGDPFRLVRTDVALGVVLLIQLADHLALSDLRRKSRADIILQRHPFPEGDQLLEEIFPILRPYMKLILGPRLQIVNLSFQPLDPALREYDSGAGFFRPVSDDNLPVADADSDMLHGLPKSPGPLPGHRFSAVLPIRPGNQLRLLY